MSSDGGGIGGGAPLGGGSAGTGVAIGESPSTPYAPSSSDIGSDRAGGRVDRGLDGTKSKAARERGDRRPPVKEQADVEGERRAGIGNSLKKAHGKQAQKEAAKASRQPAADPGDGSVAPQRFTAAAKAKWAEAPAEVREAASRSIAELEHGLRQYQVRAQRDYALDGWHNLAASAGTTVPQYLSQVARVEMGLRSTNVAEKIAAIEHCLTLAQTDPWSYAAFVNQDTAEARQARSTNLAIGQVAARTEELGTQVASTQMTQLHQANWQHTDALVKGFMSGRQDFDELSWDIERLIREDPDQTSPQLERLERAYNRAKAHRRSGRSSISGSPANGTDMTRPRSRDGQHISIDAAIKRAASRAGM